MKHPELERIRNQCTTDAAKAAVDFADKLLSGGAGHDEVTVQLVTEARQWVDAALKIDKASADAVIKDLQSKINAKAEKRDAAERMRARADGTVVPLREAH